jgi:hypothetical protein
MAGEYSERHIEGIFDSEEKANEYAKLFDLVSMLRKARIKAYELNSKDEDESWYDWIRCTYNVDNNTVVTTEGEYYEEGEYVYGLSNNKYFEFSVRFDEQLADESVLLKIAQDRWAKYKYEHSDEEETDV